MFKTRKPSSQVTILSNPRIDFDYSELTKSAKLFLGKELADKLLEAAFKKQPENSPNQNKNEKEFLILLAHMEYAARYYRDNPQDEPKWEFTEKTSDEDESAPYYVPKSRNKGRDARSTRNHYVHEFLQVIALRTEKSYRLNLPYRVRSQAQRNTLSTNRSEVVRDEKAKGTENEYKLRIHISTADLPRIAKNLSRGENSLALRLSSTSQVPNVEMPIEIVWGDELPHRPELNRQILGRQTDALLADGKSSLDQLGREERGAQIHILGGNNCRGTYQKTTGGEIQIQLEPMVEIKTGLEAFENEVGLMEYLNEQYSCSPQEFFDAIPQITQSLENDLEAATRLWLNVPADEIVSEEEKTTFLQEYNQTCLTMQTVPTPLGSISLNRMNEWKLVQGKDPFTREKGDFERAKNSRDILEEAEMVLTNTDSVAPILELPFEKTIKGVKEESFGNIASVNPGASISKEWMEEIAKSTIERANPNPYQEPEGANKGASDRQIKALESVASALGITPEVLRYRRQLILENFYGIGEGSRIDRQGPEKATFKAYALTDEDRERFYFDLEYFNQKDFESKGDTPLDASGNEVVKPELATFVQGTNMVELEIPLGANSIHRMTRYPTGLRSSGKDVSRYPYGHPKHLPRDRGQKNNAVQELRVEDFLSEKGMADFKAANSENGTQAARDKVEAIQKTLNTWNKGYGLILPTRTSSPIDSRAGQWLNGLLRTKKEGGGPDDRKCNTLGELTTLLNCLSRIAGMKVGGVDTPLQTQPLPSISSVIPLKLLCGVNPDEIEELKNIHENPIELRDLEARWENGLKADIGQEPDVEMEDQELNEILNSNPETQMNRNIEAVLQEPEDHLRSFNLAMGMGPTGIEALPKEIRPFRALLPILKSSPLTIKIEGEEMSLSSLCNIATGNMTPEIQKKFQFLSEEDRKRMEGALQKRAIEFKTDLEQKADAIGKLSKENNPLKPRGQRETNLLLPGEEKASTIESVSSGLSDAIFAIEEDEKESGKADLNWVQTIAKAITNPEISQITFGENANVIVQKGLDGKLEVTEQEGEKTPEVELVLQTINVLTGQDNTLPDRTREAVETVLQEAKSQEVVRNAKDILDVLQSIPSETARGTSAKAEYAQAKAKMDIIVKLGNAQKALDFQAKNWGHFEETNSASIEFSQVVFDFQSELESITKKGFGSDPDLEPLRQEFLLLHGEEAKKIFIGQGEENTRNFLRNKGKEYFENEKNIISRESTQLLQVISQAVHKLAQEITPEGNIDPKSQNQALKDAFEPKNGLFDRICSLVETNQILSRNLRTAELETTALPKKDPKLKEKPTPVIPDAIQKGTKTPGTFRITEDGVVKTDKIWIKDILESPRGQETIELGNLATQWACEGKSIEERRERAAFLIYLKGKSLEKTALLATKNPEGKAAMEKALTAWTEKLAILHIDGSKKINTLLAATVTLQQLDTDVVLGKDFEKTIATKSVEEEKKMDAMLKEACGPEQAPSEHVKVEFEQNMGWDKKAVKVASPFLQGEEREQALNLIERHKKETLQSPEDAKARKLIEKHQNSEKKGTRIRQVRGAAEVLHQKQTSEIGMD